MYSWLDKHIFTTNLGSEKHEVMDTYCSKNKIIRTSSRINWISWASSGKCFKVKSYWAHTWKEKKIRHARGAGAEDERDWFLVHRMVDSRLKICSLCKYCKKSFNQLKIIVLIRLVQLRISLYNFRSCLIQTIRPHKYILILLGAHLVTVHDIVLVDP